MLSVRIKPQIGTVPLNFTRGHPLTAVRQAAKQSVPYYLIRGPLKFALVLFFCLFWPNYGQPQSVHSKTYSIQPLSPDEVKLSRYRISTKGMAAKNQAWLKEVRKRDYQNQKFLEEETKRGEKILYGLQAESISAKRLTLL